MKLTQDLLWSVRARTTAETHTHGHTVRPTCAWHKLELIRPAVIHSHKANKLLHTQLLVGGGHPNTDGPAAYGQQQGPHANATR